MPKQHESLSATEIVNRIVVGDHGAESELVRRYRNAVLIVLKCHNQRKDIIDDLFQETFRIALEKIRQNDVKNPDKLGAFLAGIARNITVEYYRKEQSHRDKLKEHRPFPTAVHVDPLARLRSNEIARLISETLSTLNTDRDREILTRFFIAQEEKKAICLDLDLDSVHFNRVLFRAKKRFRLAYQRIARKNKKYSS